MRQGVFACLAAGAIWGGIFVGPRMLPQYDALTFSLTRYACFGLLSCVLFGWAHRSTPVRAKGRDVITAAWLGLTGNVIYFIALVMAIQWTSIAYASLIVGLLPVTTTLVTDWRERRAGLPVVGIRRLLPPLAVIGLGVLAVNADLFVHLPATGASGAGHTLLGVAAAFGALSAWTIYAVLNSEYLRAHPGIDSGEWATLQGIGTLFWVVLAIATWSAIATTGAAASPQLITALANPLFAIWILYLGIGASWVGTALWNYGAKSLPPTLAGQMIVFETVFGLFYGFLYETRLPRPLETVGIICLLSGVIWAVRAHRPRVS